MFNIAILSGRLTADPELKTTQSGLSVCSFTIAVERRFKQGEERQSDFITIVTWRQTAEFVSKHFKKGSVIGIEGSIQTRKYQDKDGNNRTAFEVVANNVQFMESKRSEGNGEGKFSPNIENDPLVELQGNIVSFTEVDTNDDLPF